VRGARRLTLAAAVTIVALVLDPVAVTVGARARADVPGTPGPLVTSDATLGTDRAVTVGPGAVRYRPPVSGAVLRPFEPPRTSFGSGHRGVDLAAVPGAAVGAAAAGTVTFAGTVAGTRWVSVAHADGVVTSYGPIGAVEVSRGQVVGAGQGLGRLAVGGHGAGDHDLGLHWGARRDGVYLDPLSLLDEGIARPSLVGPGGWRGIEHAVAPYQPWGGARLGGLGVAGSPTAERPGFAVPPGPNRLVLVAGLGSDTDREVLDAEHLGYDAASVSRFSYAGLDADGTASVYGPEHTVAGIDAAAERLAEQLREQAAREPGRAVDLVGHSMGGVVVLRYLTRHHDPYDRRLPPIGSVVTIASPHRGTDVASLALAARDHLPGGLVLGGLHALSRWTGVGPLGGLPYRDPALEQLAVGSDLLAELGRDWDAALTAGPAGPLAMGTRLLTIGGRGDLVVPISRSGQPTGRVGPVALDLHLHDEGGRVDHRVLPGGHSAVLETEAVREVTWRFLAGQEVVDSPGHGATWASGLHASALSSAAIGVRVHDLAGTLALVRRGLRLVVPRPDGDGGPDDGSALARRLVERRREAGRRQHPTRRAGGRCLAARGTLRGRARRSDGPLSTSNIPHAR
jgi:hypothetical protein